MIYPPAFYAKTEELIELCKVAAKYHGKYISHMRSEGNRLLEALDELLRIAREANIPAEVYHIKAAGQKNWSKEDELLTRIEARAKEGLKVRANMYTYTAAGTGLDACLPPWTEDGGYPALFKRLRDPATRKKSPRKSPKIATSGKIFISAQVRPTGFCWSDSNRTNLNRSPVKRWRSGGDARQRSHRYDHGFDRGRRITDWHDLFFDVGGERQKRTGKAMDFIRF